MPAPVNSVGGSPYGQPDYRYAGTVRPGQGRPDQVGMPRYNYQPRPPAQRFPQMPGPTTLAQQQLASRTSDAFGQPVQQPGSGGLFGNLFGGGAQISTGIGTGQAVGSNFLSQMNNGLIHTSVQPQNIYSQDQTTQAMHQGVASAQQGANMPWLQSQMRRPGMSVNSPAMQSRALPAYAGALAAGNEAQYAIPMEDMIANANFRLSGETAREDEALGWGRLQSMMNTAQQRFGAQLIANLLSQFGG